MFIVPELGGVGLGSPDIVDFMVARHHRAMLLVTVVIFMRYAGRPGRSISELKNINTWADAKSKCQFGGII